MSKIGAQPTAVGAGGSVSGKVMDQTAHKPPRGVKVNLFKLTGTWKFWTLSDQELVSSQITSESGDFGLSGEIPRYYVVEIDVEDLLGSLYESLRSEGRRVLRAATAGQ